MSCQRITAAVYAGQKQRLAELSDLLGFKLLPRLCLADIQSLAHTCTATCAVADAVPDALLLQLAQARLCPASAVTAGLHLGCQLGLHM